MIEVVPQRSYVCERANPLEPADFPQVARHDQLFYDGREGELKTLRPLLSQFQTQPAGDIRLLVINHADQLSELAQNTLLKAIEEPPSKGAAVLSVRSVESLLPTLRSRLQKLSPVKRVLKKEQTNADFAGLYTKDRQVVMEELERLLMDIDISSPAGATKHNLVSRAVRRLRQNVNLKLTLDWLGLNWNRDFGIE